MKKLLLLVPMLAWSGVTAAQQSEAEADQCNDGNRPFVSRVDVSPAESDDDNHTVLQVNIEASHPSGAALSYDFRTWQGSISGDGSAATWSVNGDGPFYATVEVSGAGSACTVLARLTYERSQNSVDQGGE